MDAVQVSGASHSQGQVVAHADVRGFVAALWVYPIKSCAGVALQEARLLATGLEWDRHWMVVDQEGLFLSQRECPTMALVQPRFEGGRVVLSAPGMPQLALDNAGEGAGTGASLRVQVWDDVVLAQDCGPAAAQWFSGFLGVDNCRLVRFDPRVQRLSSRKWTQGVEAPNQFSDGYPVLVTSQAALDGLNTRLVAGAHQAVTMERFRPNLVLGGVEAHDEDHLGTLDIAGQARLGLVKPCARCPIPNIDPATAQSDPSVGDTLQGYRQDARLNGAVTFGMNAIVLSGSGSMLRVGDTVFSNYLF